MIIMAFAHEADIQKQCRETGHAGSSAWLGDFNCSPIKPKHL